jgi:hypothetical protein
LLNAEIIDSSLSVEHNFVPILSSGYSEKSKKRDLKINESYKTLLAYDLVILNLLNYEAKVKKRYDPSGE